MKMPGSRSFFDGFPQWCFFLFLYRMLPRLMSILTQMLNLMPVSLGCKSLRMKLRVELSQIETSTLLEHGFVLFTAYRPRNTFVKMNFLKDLSNVASNDQHFLMYSCWFAGKFLRNCIFINSRCMLVLWATYCFLRRLATSEFVEFLRSAEGSYGPTPFISGCMPFRRESLGS